MKKLISFLIIIIILYLLSVFFAPSISSKIDSLIWLNWLTEKITDTKSDIDKNSTSNLSDVYSWAINKIDETKNKIDDIRQTAKQVEDTYNKTSDFIDETGKKIDKAKQTLDDVEILWNSIKGTINTDLVE